MREDKAPFTIKWNSYFLVLEKIPFLLSKDWKKKGSFHVVKTKTYCERYVLCSFEVLLADSYLEAQLFPVKLYATKLSYAFVCEMFWEKN